ncbi:MAG: hypothetical protein J6W57_06520, partial [Oscillospiraceae bacterium]|nr:hypothetical protein [Oscillospiraceae bacterium]
MKKKLFCLLLAIVLLALPFTAAHAETEMSDYCIYDVSDILELESWNGLESRAMEMSLRYGCGVYVIILPGYGEYTHYDGDMDKAAPDIITRNDLGYGTDRDALVLLIDSNTGMSAFGSTGPRGTSIFNSTALSELDPSISADVSFSDLDSAITKYLDECERLFSYEAENGKAYGFSEADVQPVSEADPDAMLTDCVYDYAGILTADQKEQLE